MNQEDQRRWLEAALAPFVRDVRSTLDRHFDVRLYVEHDWWMWETYNSASNLCGIDWDPGDAPDDGIAIVTAQLADEIPGFAFDDVLHAWPECPVHGNHPLYAEIDASAAVWRCRHVGGGVVCRVGDLPTVA